MSKSCSLPCLASLFLVAAACGDDHAAAPDGGRPTPDAPALDAAVCMDEAYPQPARPLTVDLRDPFALALDGIGTRCEQLVRALTDPDPARRPPALAELDVVGVTGTCRHDDVLDHDIVRLAGPLFAGLPLFAPLQDAVAHVDASATVVYLHGDFLPASTPAVPAACVDPAQLPASIPGTTLTYAWFDNCALQGESTYTVASGDTIEVGAEGYVLDREGMLRRVRALGVYVAPERVTAQLANSELYCCDGTTLDHCVGARLLVDALTGAVVTQQGLCHAC